MEIRDHLQEVGPATSGQVLETSAQAPCTCSIQRQGARESHEYFFRPGAGLQASQEKGPGDSDLGSPGQHSSKVKDVPPQLLVASLVWLLGGRAREDTRPGEGAR